MATAAWPSIPVEQLADEERKSLVLTEHLLRTQEVTVGVGQ